MMEAGFLHSVGRVAAWECLTSSGKTTRYDLQRTEELNGEYEEASMIRSSYCCSKMKK